MGFGVIACKMQSENDGASPNHLVTAVLKAVEPLVVSAVGAQIRCSLSEPWFSDIIRAAVQHILASGSTCHSAGTSSQSSITSSGSGASNISADQGERTSGLAIGGQPACSGASACEPPSEANIIWDVPCPVCQFVSASEAAFVEHIKLISVNRHLGWNHKIKCVLRQNNDYHQKLLKRFVLHNEWLDAVPEFVAELRSMTNPGSKRQFRPGGTGNNRKIRRFVQECLDWVPPPVVHILPVASGEPACTLGSAPASPDWADACFD